MREYIHLPHEFRRSPVIDSDRDRTLLIFLLEEHVITYGNHKVLALECSSSEFRHKNLQQEGYLVVPGFIIEDDLKRWDPMGLRITKIEPIPVSEQAGVKRVLRRNGLDGRICYWSDSSPK